MQPQPCRPRISLLLLAFNQASMVRAAAESCLAQRGEPLEIVLSDDASTDSTFDELQAAAAGYRGPHQVRLRRNERNLGIGHHYNRLLDETAGELLVTAAGDDLSHPDRVRRLAQAWDASGGRVDLIASDFIDMTRDGRPGRRVHTDDLGELTLDSWLRRVPYTVGATHAFTRRVMQRFGPLGEHVWYEDRVLVLRALCSGGALTIREPLVHYRRGGSSHPLRTPTSAQLTWMHHSGNRRRLAEVQQLLRDARVAGCADAVARALAGRLAQEECLLAMLEAPGVVDRWRGLRKADALPLAWRLRKFLSISWPAPSAACKRMAARWLAHESRRSGP